jgi:hypothetical protein
MIVLVILQTFFSELQVYLHWNIALRNILIAASLFFDLVFTIEFIVRSINAGREKRLFGYWFYRRGWVDFIAAVPLLFLNSGPLVLLTFMTGTTEGIAAVGVLNILKVVKAIRVTRILRLIRVMKIFGKIRNAESKMAQHHTASVSTIAVTVILAVLIIFAFTLGDPIENSLGERRDYYEDLSSRVFGLVGYEEESKKEIVAGVFSQDQRILKLYQKDELIFSRVTEEDWSLKYSNEDYFEIQYDGFTMFVTTVDINKNRAQNSIMIFAVIIVLVFGIMLIYTKHFVQTISDILFILLRGFKEKGYSLQVRIPKEYADHEIFQLSAFYNDKFLPAKLKRLHKEKAKMTSQLSMNDLIKFKKK